jgi:hypothetical protein
VLLLSQNPPRLANASHLFGFAAECSIKTVLQGHRPPQTNGPIVKGHLHSDVKKKLVISSNFASRQRLQHELLKAIRVFSSWDVSQRYCRSSDPQFNLARLGAEQKAAAQIIRLRNLWLRGAI